MSRNPSFDVAIVGGGLAGISAALELLDNGLKVVIIDRDSEQNFGGLANESLGGMTLVNTPIQRLNRIQDSPERALRDWHSFARFSEHDEWPKKWAELYVNRSVDDIYNWLKPKGIKFFPGPPLGGTGRVWRRQLSTPLPHHLGYGFTPDAHLDQ